MIGIYIGVNFKHKTAKLCIIGLNDAAVRFSFLWRWGNANKSVQQFLYAKIINGTAEKNGRQFRLLNKVPYQIHHIRLQ